MPFSAADYLALKSELTNDPLTLGLTVLAADDVANADKLNLVRSTIQIDREAIPLSEVFIHVDRDEWSSLSPTDRELIAVWAQQGSINPRAGSEVREGLLQMFGANSETRQNLLAILTEPANRITQLFKAGTLSHGGLVSPSDVANARNAV